MSRQIKEPNFTGEDYPKRGGKIFILLILIVLLIGALGASGWLFMKYKSAQKQVLQLTSEEGREVMAQKEIDELLEKVSRHVLLPIGEDPIIATIGDAASLAEQQAFYKDAEDGDKLIVYKEKAFIYSPARDIVINVGPVFIKESEGQGTETNTQEEVDTRIKVDIRNGTSRTGFAREVSAMLDATVFNITTVSVAINTEYTETVIVNLTGVDTSSLESAFGAKTVTSLPEGEPTSTADVVIILGQNNPEEPAVPVEE